MGNSSCSGQESIDENKTTKESRVISTNSTQHANSIESLLMKYYQDIDTIKNNIIVFKNGKSMKFDDNIQKNVVELLDNPDVEDQFRFDYNLSKNSSSNTDAGRIRNETFFKFIYGATASEVQKNLVTIVWCPSFVNQRIQVTNKCGVADSLRKVSAALDKHREWKKYLTSVGGTFNWRKISGTSRLSAHSFGMTIDINVAHSNYWQWDCSCTDESKSLMYKNSIPIELVEIFEKYGFIWGGKWVHYDTMHFEFRPELTQFIRKK